MVNSGKRPHAAICGFASFLHVPDNPSEQLIAAMQSGSQPDWADWSFETLQTIYADVPPRLAAILGSNPDVLILTGYSALANGLKLETGATDRRSPKFADGSGFVPQDTVTDPLRIENEEVNFSLLRSRLDALGVPHHLSGDAGEYVCNHSYFTALSHIRRSGAATRAVFVHIPAIEGSALADESASALPLEPWIEAFGRLQRCWR